MPKGLINRNFRLLWLGQTVSVLGDSAFDTTLLLWVATSLMRDKPNAPVASSAILVVIAVSSALSAPFAGVLVDRWDKRQTMLGTDLLRFVLIGLLTLTATMPAGWLPVTGTLVVIGVAVALATAATEFFNPARFVMVGDIVPRHLHGTAAGYLQASFSGAAIIGPALAAPLVVGLGVPWALALNALSFLVSYVMIRSIRVAPHEAARASAPADDAGSAEPHSLFREFTAGLQQFRTNRVILALLIISSLMMLGAGAVNALDVYFVQENLNASPVWFGIIGAAFGGGALVGALVAGSVGDRFGHAKVFCLGLLIASSIFLVYSRMSNVWPAIVLVVLFSIGLGALNTVVMPLILKVVPRNYLGRVISVYGPAAQIASVLSISVAGLIVGSLPLGFHTTVAGIDFGRIDAVFFVSALIMLTGACYAFIALRGVDKLPGQNDSDAEEPAPTPHASAERQ